MASKGARRFLKPALYSLGAATVGGGIYASLRPLEIPGSEAAAVPPPTFGPGGVFNPPNFPKVKSREEQIADLKRSAASNVTAALNKAKKGFSSLTGSNDSDSTATPDANGDEPYDLLVIGGGATGTGIALDAATRGLKVAMVERDDFSSGTSSKSTKLVHGGVRYLEKAVWELDYSQ